MAAAPPLLLLAPIDVPGEPLPPAAAGKEALRRRKSGRRRRTEIGLPPEEAVAAAASTAGPRALAGQGIAADGEIRPVALGTAELVARVGVGGRGIRAVVVGPGCAGGAAPIADWGLDYVYEFEFTSLPL